MMKKLLRKITAAAVVVCMVAVLAACGDEQTGNEDPQTSGRVDSAKADEPEEVSYTLSEAFAREGTQIWYEIFADRGEIIGKDTKIGCVYVLTNGELQIFDYRNILKASWHTLGELEQINDEDIIAILENDKKEYGQERVSGRLEIARKLLEEGFFDGLHEGMYYEGGVVLRVWRYDLSSYRSLFEQYAADLESYEIAIKNTSYNLHIYTDSTGNNTKEEEWVVNCDSIGMPSFSEVWFGDFSKDWFMNEDEIRSKMNLGDIPGWSFGSWSVSKDDTITEFGLWSVSKDGTPIESEDERFDYYFDSSVDWQEWLQTVLEDPQIQEYRKTSNEPEMRISLYAFNGDTVEYNDGWYNTDFYTLNLLGSVYSNYQIYDSYYGGYRLKNDSYLLTRTGALTTFTLDPVGTEGVAVD